MTEVARVIFARLSLETRRFLKLCRPKFADGLYDTASLTLLEGLISQTR